MSFEITQAMVEQYSANVIMLSQQSQSRLEEACQIEDVTGKAFYAERIGATKTRRRTTRHGDTPLISTPHSRRKGTIYDEEWADLIDDQDTPKALINIAGKYVINCVSAFNRAKDDYILDALGGSAWADEDGSEEIVNYAAGECRVVQSNGVVAAAGSDAADQTETALTVAKLLTCKLLLDAAEVDESRQRYFVTNAYNLCQLLNEAEVKSADYNTIKALAEGKIDTFMGFKFKRIEERPDGTGLQRHSIDTGAVRCYAFAQGAISLGKQTDIATSIDPRPDKSNAMQVYGKMGLGATRNEGPAVVEILLKAA